MDQRLNLPRLTSIIASLVLSAGAVTAVAAQNVSCESLAAVALPDTALTTVQEVNSGSFTPPGSSSAITGLPSFCRYAGVVAPKINFEVWLPTQTWNGRLQGVGNGGLAGSISYSDLANALKRGFVTVSTDTGHVASDTTWLTDPQQLIDYGSRAIHEMTVRAKRLANAFYQEPLRYSYFNGCSTGGGQALMSAQRYPADYDGMLAGAPNWNQTKLRSGGHIWTWLALHETPQSNLTSAQRTLINNAVVAKCDALDGVTDGVVDDPRICSFDAAALACAPGQNPSTGACLSATQVLAVNKIYAGSRNPRTGERIWPPYLPSSETGWGSHAGATPFGAATTFFRFAVFGDPTFDFRNFDFDTDTARGEAFAPILDATSPDLRAFRRHGAKLLMYHGFSDPLISPLASLDYYGSLVDFFGSRKRGDDDGLEDVQKFARLFMIPGMGHCSGGPGTDQFDGIQALQDWVERRIPPTRILASHLTNGMVDKTRPLCAWPQRAVYKGSGSTNDAANFVCKADGQNADDDDDDDDDGERGRSRHRRDER